MTPTAPTTGPQFTSRPRDDDRQTRKPLALWDRVKYLLLLAALFWFFVWADLADNPLLPFVDAVQDEISDKWVFGEGEARSAGLNAVAGRVPEEYGFEPSRFTEMRPGCFDVHERVKDMDANGVLGSLNFPSMARFAGRSALNPRS